LYSEKLSIIKQSLGAYYKSSDEMLFFCPKCNHHKRKLSVNIEKNKFQCWVCEYKGSKIDPLIKDRDLKQKWRQLTNQVDLSRFEDCFATEETLEVAQTLELPEYYTTLSTPNLSSIGRKAFDYLIDRGVTRSQILMHRVGFCHHGQYANRIIVPSFNQEGDLNYYIARSFGEDYLKYKNPPCSKDVVFNDLFLDWSKPIVLVEGFFDSLKYENSVPILGSTLSIKTKLFNKIVDNCKTVYICLDQDARKKELRIVKNLLDFGINVCKIKLYEYSDLGEVPDHLLGEYKNRASIVTRQDYLLQKLNFGG